MLGQDTEGDLLLMGKRELLTSQALVGDLARHISARLSFTPTSRLARRWAILHFL